MISGPRRCSDLKSLSGIDPNTILLVAFWIGKKKIFLFFKLLLYDFLTLEVLLLLY